MIIPRATLNAIELVVLGGAIAVVAFMGGRARGQAELLPYVSRGGNELQILHDRFGPARNSEHGEEWIIRDFFRDQRDGLFVDVGANHHKLFSNTYFLETQRGWSGVAIEPQGKFAEGYRLNRPRTKFASLFVSDVSNREATLFVPSNDLIASADPAFANSAGGAGARPIRANTTTLDDVLERSGMTQIDFLSIDVELHEPMVLKGFSVNRFRPKLVSIEGHVEVRQQILDYFASHGYVIVGKYLRADASNLWFSPAPKATAIGGTPPIGVSEPFGIR